MSTTSRRAPPQAEASTPEQLAVSILALVCSIERHDPDAPAAVTFRAALRRKGQNLAKAGGPSALADVLARVRTADTAQADTQEAMIDEVWAGRVLCSSSPTYKVPVTKWERWPRRS